MEEKTVPAPEPESYGAQWLSEHWEGATWAIFSVFYLVSIVFFVLGLHDLSGRDTMWFYFVILTSCFGVFSLNVILLHGLARSAVALVAIGFGAYVIPFSVYAFGFSINTAALTGIAYVIAMITISPYFVGLATLLCGICFAVLQKKYYVGLGDNLTTDVSKITAAFIALAVLAFFWRLLLQKLYDLFLTAYIKMDVAHDEISEREAKIEELTQDNTVLRDEIVAHISEIDKIIEGKR